MTEDGKNGKEETRKMLLGPAGMALAKLHEEEDAIRRQSAIVGPGGRARGGPDPIIALVRRAEIEILALDRIEIAEARRAGELAVDGESKIADGSPVLSRLAEVEETLARIERKVDLILSRVPLP